MIISLPESNKNRILKIRCFRHESLTWKDMQRAVHVIFVQIKVINVYHQQAISSSSATISNLTLGGTRVEMNKYSGHTRSSDTGSNSSLWNVNRSNIIIGNSPAIRTQQLEMTQKITCTIIT